MRLLQRHLQHVGQQPLGEPVAPEQLVRKLVSGGGQRNVVIAPVGDQPHVRELAEHPRHRCRLDTQASREPRSGHPPRHLAEPVNCLHVLLDGL